MSLNSIEMDRLSTIKARVTELGSHYDKTTHEEWLSLIREWGVLTKKWGEDSPKHPNHDGSDSFSVIAGC